MAILILVAFIILNVMINIAGFLIPIALRALVVLFVIAVVLRFFSAVKGKR